jgi:hypothetical protein
MQSHLETPMKKSGKEIPVKVSQGGVFIPDRLKVLNRTQRQAVLATVSDEQPFTSLIAYTLTPDMKGVIFATPKDTTKYRNILKQKQVAILIDTRTKTRSDYLETEAVTIIGTARPILRGKVRSELAEIFVKKHPKLTPFVNSPTTALIFVEISHCLHVSGFQRVSVWRVE